MILLKIIKFIIHCLKFWNTAELLLSKKIYHFQLRMSSFLLFSRLFPEVESKRYLYDLYYLKCLNIKQYLGQLKEWGHCPKLPLCPEGNDKLLYTNNSPEAKIILASSEQKRAPVGWWFIHLKRLSLV